MLATLDERLRFSETFFGKRRRCNRLLKQRNGPSSLNNLMIMLAIALTSFGEGLESLALPLIFAFVWIGVGLSRSPSGSQTANGEIV